MIKNTAKLIAMLSVAVVIALAGPAAAQADEGVGDLQGGTASATMSAQDDIIADGVCGTCTWSLDNTGKLTIKPLSGNKGELDSWTHDEGAPWSGYRDSIKSVVVEKTVKAKTCYAMFSMCDSLTTVDVSRLDTSEATSMSWMFYGCSALTELDLSAFNTAKVENMSHMFQFCSKLAKLDISGFDTSKVTGMRCMFEKCAKLTELDVSKFNVEKVTDFYGMFASCSGLTELDVSKFKTTAATDIRNMFHGCSGLSYLDLSLFDTAQVTRMSYLFKDCTALQFVYVGDAWTTQSVVETEMDRDMFLGCTKLAGENGTRYDAAHIGKEYARPDVEGTPGYFFLKGEKPAKGTLSMHRVYNPNSGEHFYTSDDYEYGNLVSLGWKNEGEGWLAPEESKTPVYRLYNPNNGGEHHYTIDATELETLVKAGWKDEGVGWYSDDKRTVAILREYNPNEVARNHNYTKDRAEHNNLIALGWRDEGTGWYGVNE